MSVDVYADRRHSGGIFGGFQAAILAGPHNAPEARAWTRIMMSMDARSMTFFTATCLPPTEHSSRSFLQSSPTARAGLS